MQNEANWSRLHPLTILLLCADAVALTFLGLIGSLVGFVMLAALGIGQRILLSWILKLTKYAAVLVVFVFILQAVLNHSGSIELIRVGRISISQGGLLLSCTYSLRILVLIGSVLLLTQLIDFFELGQAFLELGMPLLPTYIFISAATLVPVMRWRVRRVMEAQRARGLDIEGSFLSRLRMLPSLLFPVFYAALWQAATKAVALEARGFSTPAARITSFEELPDSRFQVLSRRSLLVALLLTVIGSAIKWLK
jgi:energy-coupling factor transport system permease protein